MQAYTLALYGIDAVRQLAYGLHTWGFACLPSDYIQVADMLCWSYHSFVLLVRHDQHSVSNLYLSFCPCQVISTEPPALLV